MNEQLRGVLGVVSGSGGVGRSTLALSIAAETVRAGGRALVLDLDPLMGLSFLAGATEDGNRAPVLEALATPDRFLSFVQQTDYPELFVLAGGVATRELFVDGSIPDRRARLARLLERAAKAFDTVVVDLPAGTGPLVRETVSVLQIVLACVVPEPLPVRLLGGVIEAVAHAKGGRSKPAFGGICLNRVVGDAPLLEEVMAELERSFPGLVLETALPADPWFIEAAARALPLPLLMPEAIGSRAIRRMVAELRSRIVENVR